MFKGVAYAKFDLAVSIGSKKHNDGYFPVRYIDCQLDIHDEIYLEVQEKRIDVVCDSAELSSERENFVYLTAQALKEEIGDTRLGAKIILKKNIPIKAGFGGGSSDGAATLIGLSRIWKIKLSEKLVKKLSRKLGKDFYYSVWGKFAEVIGEGKSYKIKPIDVKLPNFWLLVVVPFSEKPSTGWVYEHVEKKKVGRNSAKIEKLKTVLKTGDREGIMANLTNDFESYVPSYFPEVGRIKKDLKKAGASGAIMAGAGLSVVGFFGSKKAAEGAMRKLAGKYKRVIVTKIVN